MFKQLNKIAILACWCTLLSFAQTVWALNINDANNTVDALNKSIESQGQNIEFLDEAIDTLYDLSKQAKNCIDEQQTLIDQYQKSLPKIDTDKQITLTQDQQYVLDKKVAANKLKAQCRLFNIRAQELIKDYNKKYQAIKTTKILSKSEAVIGILFANIAKIETIVRQINFKASYVKIIAYITNRYTVLGAGSVIAFALVFTILLRLKYNVSRIQQRIKEIDHVNFYNFILPIRNNSFTIGVLLGYISYILFLDYPKLQLSAEIMIPLILIIYFIIKAVTITCFDPIFGTPIISNISKKSIRRFHITLNSFMAIGLLGIGFTIIGDDVILTEDFRIITKVTFYSIICFLFFAMAIAGLYLVQKIRDNNTVKYSLLIILGSIMATFIIALWIGFHAIVTYALNGIIFSSFLFIICFYLSHTLSVVLDGFILPEKSWHHSLAKLLSLSNLDIMLEITILKLAMFLSIWGAFFVFINKIWALSELWSLRVIEAVYSGITIIDTTIVPMRILASLVFFSFAMLILKIIKNHLQTSDSTINSSQEAYIIIMGYIGFAFILLVSLLIAGIDITGLALIAGALSVGIGFGLQNIVNNFFSGLVLLLERPIKSGDRIIVGEKEGFVTQVGIRSTRINTVDNLDIIVPNSELVSTKVTNMMYNNKKIIVWVPVVVEYKVDPILVEKLLIDAASQCENVLMDGADAPIVYFNKFCDNGMKFKVWATIDNVNLKYEVMSELHFRIKALFEEHNISFAFLQADLYLKEMPTPANKKD